VIDAMNGLASQYRPMGDPGEPVVQDFHSFRQALNVAAADQRPLLFVAATDEVAQSLRTSLRPVMGDPDIVGRFHSDFAGKDTDADWADAVSGVDSKSGLFIIAADQFGMEGRVLNTLPLDAGPEEIKTALTDANSEFVKTEERKVYSQHVAQGRREGIMFENGMPYGEDRDGDGEIDHRGGPSRRPGPPPRN
jgi:hypothetical protein